MWGSEEAWRRGFSDPWGKDDEAGEVSGRRWGQLAEGAIRNSWVAERMVERKGRGGLRVFWPRCARSDREAKEGERRANGLGLAALLLILLFTNGRV